MKSRHRPMGFMVALAMMLALVAVPGFTGTARAASEDVAMFYDDLSQYGQWVEDEKYGPVWRPSQVPEDWRPYTNGRWVPTTDGNVFESQEPWGWATYHYGNWMPTEGYGWVWVPGSTWYPSTVEWRTTPENEPAETAYIGWAPTPPPDYAPPPAYAPTGYSQGGPAAGSLIEPLWIFVRAASFLLGFGQPYTPAYSYVTTAIIVPPAYYPVFFQRTVFYPVYATPTYYSTAFIGGRPFGHGCYSMGPSATYLSRYSQFNQTVINQTIIRNTNNFARIHNVVPPRGVVDRHAYLRQIIPPALAQGHRLPPPRLATDIKMAQANLNRPNFVPPPKNVPKITGNIPQVQPGAAQPGRGLTAMGLPGGATMPLTPHMQQQIQQLPAQQRYEPGKVQPFKTVTATPPGPPQAAPPAHPGPAQPGTPAKPGQFGPPSTPAQVKPGGPPAGAVKPGEFHPAPSTPGAAPAGPPTKMATPGPVQPGKAPVPPGTKAVTPEVRRQADVERQRVPHGAPAGQPQVAPQAAPHPAPQPAPKVHPQAQPKPQVQPRPQPQVKASPQPPVCPPTPAPARPQVQPRPQAQPHPQPQVAPRPQPQPAPRPQPQVQAQPKPQPQAAPRPQPQPKAQSQSQQHQQQQKKNEHQ